MESEVSLQRQRLISWNELKTKIGNLSRSTIWRLERDGLFPKRISISKNRVAWESISIEEWIQKKLSGKLE